MVVYWDCNSVVQRTGVESSINGLLWFLHPTSVVGLLQPALAAFDCMPNSALLAVCSWFRCLGPPPPQLLSGYLGVYSGRGIGWSYPSHTRS